MWLHWTFFGASVVADLISTRRALANGLRELNPALTLLGEDKNSVSLSLILGNLSFVSSLLMGAGSGVVSSRFVKSILLAQGGLRFLASINNLRLTQMHLKKE